MFIIGLVMSLLGYAAFVGISIEMTTAPENSPLVYAIFMALFGFMPFICGVALCVFAARKWLKSRKQKMKVPNTGVNEEKPVDPATAALRCRANQIFNVCIIVTLILGIFVVLKLSNWLMVSLDVPSQWKWPSLLVFIFAVVVGAIIAYKIDRKLLVNMFIKIMLKYKR